MSERRGAENTAGRAICSVEAEPSTDWTVTIGRAAAMVASERGCRWGEGCGWGSHRRQKRVESRVLAGSRQAGRLARAGRGASRRGGGAAAVARNTRDANKYSASDLSTVLYLY